MANLFDGLKSKVFDTITNAFGYSATWSSPSGILTARVGYKDPSEKQELSGIGTWDPEEPFMEYQTGFFEGLKLRVDSNYTEYVTIDGKGYFAVVKVLSKFDGDTFEARLRAVTP